MAVNQKRQYNNFPPHWREVDDEEFWPKFMMHSWLYVEFREMCYPESTRRRTTDQSHVSARLFHFDDGTGLAMVANIQRARHARPRLFAFGRKAAP